jgi:hypothetical protein
VGRGHHIPALILALIHLSAWKGNSANFALRSSTKFESFLCALRHLLLWSTYCFLRQASAAFVA